MTWTGQTFTVGQILTAAQMNNLQADITAVANGDSGAPPIQSGALQNSVVDSGSTTQLVTEATNATGTYIRAKRRSMFVDGTLVLNFWHEAGAETSRVRFKINGSVQSEWIASAVGSSSPQQVTIATSATFGDIFELDVRTNGSGAAFVYSMDWLGDRKYYYNETPDQ